MPPLTARRRRPPPATSSEAPDLLFLANGPTGSCLNYSLLRGSWITPTSAVFGVLVTLLVCALWFHNEDWPPLLLLWLLLETIWVAYFHWEMVPIVARFRPEDGSLPLVPADVDRIMDNVVFLLQRDAASFWGQVMGRRLPPGELVPASTAHSFVRSLLFMFQDVACYQYADQQRLFRQALARVEAASGGFATNAVSTEELDLAPNFIRSWIDDQVLADSISSTPLLLVAWCELLRLFTLTSLWLLGWRRGYTDAASGLQAWVYRPTTSTTERPMLLVPGAGGGFFSFLPLAFLLQSQSRRPLVLFRMPWVEVGKPWSTIPQWSQSTCVCPFLCGCLSVCLSVCMSVCMSVWYVRACVCVCV
jgi:hypothetical protein